MLKANRERRGFTVGQMAWRLDIDPAKYRAIEAGTTWPDFDTWDRMCKLFGWPQSLA